MNSAPAPASAAPGTVQDVLMNQAYVPAFIKTAAAHGIAINTKGDLMHAMDIVENLRATAAAGTSSSIKTAALRLRGVLGLPVEQSAPAADASAAERVLATLGM